MGSSGKKDKKSHKKASSGAPPTAASELTGALQRLLPQLQRKDPRGLFARPVNVEEVPDYLSVIAYPMDFSTMASKLARNLYTSIEVFRTDFELICNNAKRYNAPHTVFYQDADKLLASGSKLIEKETQRLAAKLAQTNGGMAMTEDPDDNIDVTSSAPSFPSSASASSGGASSSASTSTNMPMRLEPIVLRVTAPSVPGAENQPADYIHATIAKKANKSTLVVPAVVQPLPRKRALFRKTMEGTFVFSSAKRFRTMHADGSMMASGLKEMGIVPTLPVPQTAVPTLGRLFSAASEVSEWLATAPLPPSNSGTFFKTPVAYHDNGPFASFAPYLDGREANCSAAESDLLALTYADLGGTSYVTSMESFVRDAGEFARTHVTRILDTLTGGSHSVVKSAEASLALAKAKGVPLADVGITYPPPFNVLEVEKKSDFDVVAESEKLHELAEQPLPTNEPVTIQAIRNILESAGMDASFLPSGDLDTLGRSYSPNSVQAILDKNGELIWQLIVKQKQRTSQSKNAVITEPERQLANQLRARLAKLVAQLPPGKVVSRKAIELAMPKIAPFEAVFLGTLIAPPQTRPGTPVQQPTTRPATSVMPARPTAPALVTAAGRTGVSQPAGQPQATFKTTMTTTAGRPSALSQTPSLTRPAHVRPPAGVAACANCSSTEHVTVQQTSAGTEVLCFACAQYYHRFREHRPAAAWRSGTNPVPASAPAATAATASSAATAAAAAGSATASTPAPAASSGSAAVHEPVAERKRLAFDLDADEDEQQRRQRPRIADGTDEPKAGTGGARANVDQQELEIDVDNNDGDDDGDDDDDDDDEEQNAAADGAAASAGAAGAAENGDGADEDADDDAAEREAEEQHRQQQLQQQQQAQEDDDDEDEDGDDEDGDDANADTTANNNNNDDNDDDDAEEDDDEDDYQARTGQDEDQDNGDVMQYSVGANEGGNGDNGDEDNQLDAAADNDDDDDDDDGDDDDDDDDDGDKDAARGGHAFGGILPSRPEQGAQNGGDDDNGNSNGRAGDDDEDDDDDEDEDDAMDV